MKKILLVGNPNVGKSVVFSRLTGVNVISSNYPGTTVEYSKGYMWLGKEKVEVVDVPGTYSLEPNTKAEEIAVQMLEEAVKNQDSVVINVVDATNLERSLNLTLQLIRKDIPVIIDLNLWDETRHLGISIDDRELERILNVPVVPTCAVTGEGIDRLVARIPEARACGYFCQDEEKWESIGRIISRVQKVGHRHHTLFERIGEASIKPLTGIPIAMGLMYMALRLIRLMSEGIIKFVLEPIFREIWLPLMTKVSFLLGSRGFFHDILIGKLFEGRIDFGQSFGILTTGLFVPFAQVFPYLLSFYLILSFFEDSGYLPRLGVLVDSLMHQVGLHGFGIVPMLLGLGCNVPGVLATRIMETRRERFIALTLMCIAVPCMAKMAMIVGLVGRYGMKALWFVFGSLSVIWITVGVLLNFLVKGESPEIFVEIPPYRIPYFGALGKKVWMRVKGFLREAVPFVLLGVLLANVLYALGIIDFIGRVTGPLLEALFGLPSAAVAALLIGFLRKDVAIGMLFPLGLTLKQTVIASIILGMYFPCVATFAVLIKELGMKDMLKAVLIMLLCTIAVGGILNLFL